VKIIFEIRKLVEINGNGGELCGVKNTDVRTSVRGAKG
jgi:hypothetical protein